LVAGYQVCRHQALVVLDLYFVEVFVVCLAAARLLGHLVEGVLVLDLVVVAVFVVQGVGLVEAAAADDCGWVGLVQDLGLAGVGHVVVEVHLHLVARPFVVAGPFLCRGVCESFFPDFSG
jgi:hypothetical protein